MVYIVVNPVKALVDEPVSIVIRDLNCQQLVTVYSTLTSEPGDVFECYAHFVANKEGVLDLTKQPSVGGSYTGIEPMGLFWAMKPSEKNLKKHSRLTKQNVSTPLVVNISVYNGHIRPRDSGLSNALGKTSVERWYKLSGVQRVPVRCGRIRATLFLPPGNAQCPGIIDMFGTVGGLIEFRASLLASRGFATLALAYFGYEDLPTTVLDFDLEYCEEAMIFLENHHRVSKQGIGVLGVSFGGSIALAMGSYFPGITHTIVINSPIYAQYSDFNFKGRIWRAVDIDMNRYSVENNALNLRDVMKVPKLDEIKSAMLEFYKTDKQFLFLYSEDDKAIHCGQMCEIIRHFSTLNKNCSSTLYTYPGAGHLLEPPYSPHAFITHTKLFNAPQVWGGNASQHAKAQEKSWADILNFFGKMKKL